MNRVFVLYLMSFKVPILISGYLGFAVFRYFSGVIGSCCFWLLNLDFCVVGHRILLGVL